MIVIIGILAAIVIVAYNGITRTAQATAITNEVKQWAKLFEVYKAANGSYPLPVAPPADPTTSGGTSGGNPAGIYCLGTGFPTSGGTPYCYGVTNPSYRAAESTGTYLLSQLSTVGTPPSNTEKYVYGNVTGPYMNYVDTDDVRLFSVYTAGTTCPSGMVTGGSDAHRQYCFIRLNYNN